MAQSSYKENITILDAVDNLSSMADIDLEGVQSEGRAALERLRETARWLDIENQKKTQTLIKKTFSVVHDYMKHIVKKDSKALKDLEMQKGIQAIMGLARAAANRVDELYKVIDPKMKESKIIDFNEFKSLENFYQKQVIDKFQEALDSQQEWLKEFADNNPDVQELYSRKIRGLEQVKRDQEYDLLYIKKENGRPFISTKLLRNLKLVTDFDEMIIDVVGDDPLIYVKIVQDQDAFMAANEVLKSIHSELDEFVKIAQSHKDHGLTQTVYKALLALFSAAHRGNLIREKKQKSCLAYFRDFHSYLKNMVHHEDYLRLHEDKEGWEGYEAKVMSLVHTLCSQFFLHRGDQIKSIEFVRDLLKRGQLKEASGAQFSIWTWILDCYDSVHQLLSRYPNGPLMKSLDIFKEAQYKEGFNPMDQDNFPSELFSFQSSDVRCQCLHLPSPTAQRIINKASVVEEFKGLIHYFSQHGQKEKLLIFNLQDRTSWKEHARADCLEKLQNEADMKEHLTVVTLAKHTDFYFQSDEYLMNNDATSFKTQLLDQLKSGRTCGFYFPQSINHKDLFQFSEKAIDAIHQCFFGGKNVLTRKNRLDFIEIFYQLIQLKIIFVIKPTYMSFSCKDGVDVGASAALGLYGFLKLLHKELTWSEEEKDLILRIIFAPALLIRERNIEIQRLSRIVSVLALINSERDVHKNSVIDLAKELLAPYRVDNLDVFS